MKEILRAQVRVMGYKEHPEIYDRLRQFNHSKEVHFINEVLKKYNLKDCTIVDVGCGSGGHVKLLRQIGYNAIGVDLSHDMIEFARKNYENPKIFSMGDMKNYKIKSNSIISMHCAINYSKNEKDLFDALNNFKENLSNGGILIIDTKYSKNLGNKRKEMNLDLPEEKIHLTSEWEPEGKMSATYRTKIRVVSNESYVDTEEHSLKFLDPIYLRKVLFSFGFKKIEIFGDFDFKPFGPFSERGIIVCQKCDTT